MRKSNCKEKRYIKKEKVNIMIIVQAVVEQIHDKCL